MNRSLSTTIYHFLHNFLSFSFFSIFPSHPFANPRGVEGKMRRDLIAGWLPKLLFVLTFWRHIKLNTDQSSHSPRRDLSFRQLTFHTTGILWIIPPTLDFPKLLVLPFH